MARRLASLLAAAPLAMSLLVPAGAAASVAPTPGAAVLATSQCLVANPKNVNGPGTSLVSGSGVFTLLVTSDSVEIDENEPLGPGGPYAGATTWWQFLDNGSRYLPPNRSRLCMRSDGNLALHTSQGRLIWSSHTAGTGTHNYVTMQNDGNLVMRTASGRVVWSSATTRTILPNGGVLASGQHMVYRYRQQFGVTPTWLTMQRGGDLVLTLGKRTVWSTGTHVLGAYARLLPHGDLALYAPSGKIIWRSGTSGGRSFLEIVTGCVSVNTSRGAIWYRPRIRACRA